MTTTNLDADTRAREQVRVELARILHDADCGCGTDDPELEPYFAIVDMLLDSPKIRTNFAGSRSISLEITPDK